MAEASISPLAEDLKICLPRAHFSSMPIRPQPVPVEGKVKLPLEVEETALKG